MFLMSDFETTTDPEDCRVWAWGLYDIDEDKWLGHGVDIESFFVRLSQNSCVVYFHNLAFDGSFIIDYLLNNGYRWVPGRELADREFSTVISRMGKFYTITVKIGRIRIEFRDSLKKIPVSVARIAKAYKLPMSKGEINYTDYRAPGHELTPEELDYLKRDIIIVGKALKVQFDQGMHKLTTGADSLFDFRTMFGKKSFASYFPTLSIDVDNQIRKAYRGGWCYVAPEFKGRVVGGGMVFDVNSLYPSVMYDRLLPYGEPLFMDGGPEKVDGYPLWIASVTFTARIKPHHYPCIQLKGYTSFGDTEYVEEIPEPVTLCLTSVDYELWSKHYDIDVYSWNYTYLFRGVSGLFVKYIDKWMRVKAESTGALREIAKLHLNSLYGKFATNSDVTGKYPVLDDGVVKYRIGNNETRDPIYTPMGVFITAYARDVTIRAAQSQYGCFAYADTDSLHLIRTTVPDDIDVHPTKLGAWKLETTFNRAFYVRAKCYVEDEILPTMHRKNRRVVHNVHIAGLPASVADQVSLSTFKNGTKLGGKLLPKHVPGGTVLVETEFTINL